MTVRVDDRELERFERDLVSAINAIDREMPSAMRKAGAPGLRAAVQLAPRRTGRLASSGRVVSDGRGGAIEFAAPYASLIENAQAGRFRNLTSRYGPPPRFAAKGVERAGSEMLEEGMKPLDRAFTVSGWFRDA